MEALHRAQPQGAEQNVPGRESIVDGVWRRAEPRCNVGDRGISPALRHNFGRFVEDPVTGKSRWSSHSVILPCYFLIMSSKR